MSIRSKIKYYVNAVIRRTSWYDQDIFGDCRKFWNHRIFNLDLVNLGSGAAKYGFDYSETSLRAANWAMAPQTFVGDYVVLANYLSYLKEEAVVIMTLCPFTCLDDGKRYLPDKMYTIADMISIPDFAIERKMKTLDVKNNPVRYFPLMRVGSELIFFLFGSKMPRMNSEKLEKSAKVFIDSWKEQFSLIRLSDEFSLVNKDRFFFSVQAFDRLLTLCKDHHFKPVLILPPVSRHLLQYFDDDFQKRYIYDYVNSSKYTDVPFLNYLGDKEFEDDNLYRNANFLNPEGARKFTKRVLDDLVKKGIVEGK